MDYISLFGKKRGFFMEIPIDIHTSLKTIAATKHISMSRLITKVLISYVEKEYIKEQSLQNKR